MLEKPNLPDVALQAALLAEYGLAAQVEFLPLGADAGSAVYRAVTGSGTSWFVKLRQFPFDELAVRLPRFLCEQGVPHILPPRPTQAGRLWVALDDFALIVYPFIEGRDGYEQALSLAGWMAFGAAVRAIHSLALPGWLTARLERETYTPHWRDMLAAALAGLETAPPADALAAEMADLLRPRREELLRLAARAQQLAHRLQRHPDESVLCHTDLHPGNLLIEPDGNFFIVDWDAPLLALKERDLMFIAGGQGFIGLSPEQETAWFYAGYGETAIHADALAYYRAERVIQDVALFCADVLQGVASGADRAQSLHYIKSTFRPGGALEAAEKTLF